MINIKIYKEKRKSIGFEVLGHSDNAETCAKISTITQSAYMSITEYLKREVYGEDGNGKLKIMIEGQTDEQTEAVMKMLEIGVREISKTTAEVNISEISRDRTEKLCKCRRNINDDKSRRNGHRRRN